MSHVGIEKRVLFWPRLTEPVGGLQLPSGHGVPGPIHEGCAVFPPIDTGGAAYQVPNNGTAPLDVLTRHLQRINLPPDTQAIGISPDSSIACCDIYIGGNNLNRHRISPGNPFVGCPNSDFALVSLPISITPVVVSTNSVAADCSLISSGGSTIPTFPLRLEIHRGCIAPRSHRRAPLSATMVSIDADTTESGGLRIFYVCTDGRSKIDVVVGNEGPGNVAVACWAYEAKPQSSDMDINAFVVLAVDDTGATSLTVPALSTAANAISLDGNPVTILAVRCTVDADNTNFFVHVRAWDD